MTRSTIRRLAIAASALPSLLAYPAGASAVTIGETFTPTIGCGPATVLQIESPGQSYVVPSPGLITSWSHRGGADPPEEASLRLGRPAGGNNYTVVAESALEEDITANELNTFDTRIPVSGGELLGLFFTGVPDCSSLTPGFTWVYNDSDVGAGETEPFIEEDAQLDVSAEFKPYRCGGRNATIAGTAGPDRLIGTPGKDVIAARGGRDVVKGLGGKDRLCGAKGKDKLKGGGGNDKLKGAKGKDRLVGGGGRDKCVGGKGDDIAKKCEVERSI